MCALSLGSLLWALRCTNFVLWNLGWIEDVGWGVRRIWVAFETLQLHEVKPGESVRKGEGRVEARAWILLSEVREVTQKEQLSSR